MPRRRPPKIIGEWVECEFLARAAQHGLVVSKPYGDSAPFDFVVGGRQPLHRVQVRGTSHLTNGRCYICRITHGYPPVRYSPDEIDFMAVFVIPYSAWYIVPIHEIQPCQRFISLYPHKPGANGRLECFRDAWRLLGATPKTFLRPFKVRRSRK